MSDSALSGAGAIPAGTALFHASSVSGLRVLTPHVSNHGTSLLYLSVRRENTLVYLSNAVERYCRGAGIPCPGVWQTWASYGFTKTGLPRLEEYYPDALRETYSGVSGFVYTAEMTADLRPQPDIPGGVLCRRPLPVVGCEAVPDAYEAILQAERAGTLVVQRYADNSPAMLDWIASAVKAEDAGAAGDPAYRCFLRAKFPFLSE